MGFPSRGGASRSLPLRPVSRPLCQPEARYRHPNYTRFNSGLI